MKRIFAAIISIIIAGSIASCGTKENTSDKDESETKATTATTTAAETTAATAAEVTTTAETTTAVETTTVETTTEVTTTKVENVDKQSQIEVDWNGTVYEEQFKNITYHIPKNYTYDDSGELPIYYYEGGMVALTLNKAFGQIDDNSIKQIIEVLESTSSEQKISDYYVDDDFLVIKASGITQNDQMTYMRHIAASVGDALLFFHIYDTESDEHAQAVFDNFYKMIEYEHPIITKKSADTLLFDNNDFKIYYTGYDLDASYSGPEIKLLIENKSSINYTFQIDSCSVDGYMVDTIMSEEVGAGKKSNCEFTLRNSSLEKNNIDSKNIKEIDLSFRIFNTDTWDDIAVTTPIKIIV